MTAMSMTTTIKRKPIEEILKEARTSSRHNDLWKDAFNSAIDWIEKELRLNGWVK